MRQNGKNNRQRGRGRRNGSGQINRNTTLDSNGPDVRLRGNAQQLHEKYVGLGNDASAAGERIQAEAYYQYADHYFRVHSAIVASSEERRERHQENKHSSDVKADQPNADAQEDTGADVESEAAEVSGDDNGAETINEEDAKQDEDQQVAV